MNLAEIYLDPERYDRILGDFKGDIEFYLEQARDVDGAVLDLGCGTGRITLPLARAGVDVSGMDSSQAMLDVAAQRSMRNGLNIEWVHGDCRDFNLNKKYKAVFMPYNFFQHLLDRESQLNCLHSIYRHLVSGGRVVMDIHFPQMSLLARKFRRYFWCRSRTFPFVGQ